MIFFIQNKRPGDRSNYPIALLIVSKVHKGATSIARLPGIRYGKNRYCGRVRQYSSNCCIKIDTTCVMTRNYVLSSRRRHPGSKPGRDQIEQNVVTHLSVLDSGLRRNDDVLYKTVNNSVMSMANRGRITRAFGTPAATLPIPTPVRCTSQLSSTGTSRNCGYTVA